MGTIGVRQLKSQTSEILRRVEEGEEIVVTRRGKPCAKLIPTASVPEGGSAHELPLKGRFREWPDLSWEDFQEAKRIWHRISDPRVPDD